MFTEIFDDKLMLELSQCIGAKKYRHLGIALGFTKVSIDNMEHNMKYIEDMHLEILCVSIQKQYGKIVYLSHDLVSAKTTRDLFKSIDREQVFV